MLTHNLNTIDKQLYNERKLLADMVKRYGLSHPMVVKISQKLDHIIVDMQKSLYS